LKAKEMTKFDWPLQKNTIGWSEKMALIKFLLTSDRFTNGPKCKEFEQAWSRWEGCQYSLFVSSGSTANTLLLDAVHEKYFSQTPKLKILAPAINWATNISTFRQQGHDISFYDIDYKTYSPTVESINHHKNVLDFTPDIIYVTHIMGIAADLAVFKQEWPDAIILEDCCESHGAKTLTNRKVGTEGLGSTFSFYFGHHMTTVEGGMVCTDDEELYNLMRAKRSHGMSREMISPYKEREEALAPSIDPMFLFPTLGYNFRNTELGAVLGLCQLPKLDHYNKRRAENYEAFVHYLSNHPWIQYFPKVCGNSAMTLPFHCHTEWQRDELKILFTQMGIETRPFLVGNLLKQPFMQWYKKDCPLPNSERIHTHSFYIGNNHFVTIEDIKNMATVAHQCAS
jgi:CDP-6-deoxy-D-xylo-4-hexulose-3-dehydrase